MLLTQELQSLPERFDRFVELTRENNELVNRRLERLEEGQQRLGEGQQRLEERQQRLEEGQQRLEERQQRLEEGQQRLEREIETLKTDVGTLEGSDTERRARENILNIAKDELGPLQGEHTASPGPGHLTSEFLGFHRSNAEAQGPRYSESQADYVLLADIIILGPLGSGPAVRARRIRGVPHHRAERHPESPGTGPTQWRPPRARKPWPPSSAGRYGRPSARRRRSMDVRVLIPAMFNPPETGEEPAGPASP